MNVKLEGYSRVASILALLLSPLWGQPQTKESPGTTLANAIQNNLIRGVSSFRQNNTLYTAYLLYGPTKVHSVDCELVITSQKIEKPPVIAFHIMDPGCDWDTLATLNGSVLNGFVLWWTGPDSFFGKTVVFAFVDGKFTNAYGGDYPSEIVDIDGDGVPEIIGSRIDMNGDTKGCKIYLWNGSVYKFVMNVQFEDRLGRRVLNAVRQYRRHHPVKMPPQ